MVLNTGGKKEEKQIVHNPASEDTRGFTETWIINTLHSYLSARCKEALEVHKKLIGYEVMLRDLVVRPQVAPTN
jgi:hypothetical protein